MCLFLAGGNDANNLIVPSDTTGYNAYAAGRGALALPRSGLLGVNVTANDGHTYGLHPAMPELQALFNQGRATVMANVGTLCFPTTKTQYNARSVPLPNQLFSHNDQQVEWQSSLPDRPFTTGWGGRLADLVNAFNQNNAISMSISLNGQNSFQVGGTVAQYSVNSTGAVALTGTATGTTTLAGVRTRAQSDLLAAQQPGLLETAFATETASAISDSALVTGFLSGNAPFTTVFPTTSLGNQLRTIARLISAAPQLGLRRQIFFARIGGWDLHDDQVVAGGGSHQAVGQDGGIVAQDAEVVDLGAEAAQDISCGQFTFKKEAYRLPTFEVVLNAPQTVALDTTFDVDLLARYFAGGLAADRPVIVVAVDAEHVIRRVIPDMRRLVKEGLLLVVSAELVGQ